MTEEEAGMRVRPLVAWYDCWVGVYWDRSRRRLYVLPLPMVGVVIEFGRRTKGGTRGG